jgi:hypothetical protein
MGHIHGGFVSNPVRAANGSGECAAPFADSSDRRFRGESPVFSPANGLTALSFEFVATPERAASAPRSLPATIHAGLGEMIGFAGSLVMVSDQEARLITVVIFWEGYEGAKSSTLCIRRVRAVLAPYLDRYLRVQTMVAHLPAPRVLPAKTNPADPGFILQNNVAQDANVCAA